MMAECDSEQRSASACTVAHEHDAYSLPTSNAKALQTVKLVPPSDTNFDNILKLKKHQNGLVPHLLKTTDDVDNGESADSGHGSSCQECECASTLSQLAIESEMSQLLSDDNVGVPTCQYTPDLSSDSSKEDRDGIRYVVYESEAQMPDIIRLITKDLSEPYSIYTYRYFIHNWPKLCFLVSILSYNARQNHLSLYLQFN